MNVYIRWEDERERAVVEALNLDWIMYGEMHLTNANGVTRLDPRGIKYEPPAGTQGHESPGVSITPPPTETEP